MNPDKLQSVQQKLEAFLAQEKEQKERAQRCFVSYLRSVYLMKNKDVFDVFKIQLLQYAVSLGLAVAPRVRFLNKAQAQRAESGGQGEEEQQSDEEEELRSFKVQLKGDAPMEEDESSDSEDSEEGNNSGDEGDILGEESRTRLQGADESEDEDDLRDFDLLKVKIKDVFSVTGDKESEEEEEPAAGSKKKTAKETKFKEAKKALKRNFQVNTKVAFSEEGEAVQLWPQVQRPLTAEEEQEEEEDLVSGISVQKARERLQREDQFDKQLYSSKIKAKHREQRLKAKAARREASKQHAQDEEDEEDEVVAYLANHSEDEFDPDSLPDPDKVSSEQESAKRKQSSEDEEEDVKAQKKKKLRQQEDEEHEVLDTGLSLAEDEELVLHLLGGRR